VSRGASLQARLLAGALVWILAALAVAGVLLTDLFRRHVESQFRSALEIHLNELVASLEWTAGAPMPGLVHPTSDPAFRKPYSGLYWQVSSESGAPFLRSRSLWDAVLALPADAVPDGGIHHHRLPGPGGTRLIGVERTVTLPGAPGATRVAVARDESGLHGAVASFAATLAASLAVLAAGLAGAAVVQVRLGLRPLDRLRRALAGLRLEGGSSRLEGEFPKEVEPLVDDLNALIRHNADLLERARTQAGNLAHALKTPLAVMTNEAARMGEEGRVLREQLERARRQVDIHLARARAAAAGGASGHKFAVEASLAGLRAVMERVHSDKALVIELATDSGHLARGERQDFEEMLGNLMDNACKWAHGLVRVETRIRDRRLIVSVDDDGPGLPPERREEVFGRGRRLDEAAPGSGLGLAIVRDLAELGGGGVHLDDSPLGGLRAVLELPGEDMRG
jgi:signal transduction histidine kinase